MAQRKAVPKKSATKEIDETGWEVKQLGWYWYVLGHDHVLGSGTTKRRALERARAFMQKISK
jgi:hypothetical protein